MKKIIMIAVFMVGLTGMAQKGQDRGNRGMKDLTPEQRATLQTKKMTLALDLTEGQQKQVMALQLKNAERHQAKREERKAQREAGTAKKPTAEERYTMANARLDDQIAQKAEVQKILSDTQYAKWEKMQHRSGKYSNRGHDKERSKGKRRSDR